MDYRRHYDLLIEKHGSSEKPKNVYTERHRKVPGCLGGEYVDGNAYYLSARAHFLAHALLVKMNPGNRDLVFALWAMCAGSSKHERPKSKRYEWLRKSFASAISAKLKGVPKPDGFKERFRGSNNPMFGRKHSEKSIKIMRDSAARPLSEQHKQAIAKANSGKVNVTLKTGLKTRVEKSKVREVTISGGKIGWRE